MLIAVYYTEAGEEFWACAGSIEPLITDLVCQMGEEVNPDNLKVFEAREVKVSKIVKWNVLDN